MFDVGRIFGSRIGAACAALTLLGVVVISGPTTAGAGPPSWSITPSPFDVFTPGQTGTQPAPADPFASVLQSVACADSQFCISVGGAHALPASPTLNEVWNGNEWSLAPRSEVINSRLTSVSCSTRRFCFAVGASTNPTDDSDTTLTEMWNGHAWSVPPSPNASEPNSPNNDLADVSCLSPKFCFAVGGSTQTVIESWNGTLWSVVGAPNSGHTLSRLTSVSCATSNFCLAVGSTDDVNDEGEATATYPLYERWNGSAWTVIAGPDISDLSDISCVSRSFCMATGDQTIERFNGSSWTVTPTPSFDAPLGVVYPAVSCVRPSFCVASEFTGTRRGTGTSTVMTWDGKAWSVPTSAPRTGGMLYSASCASSRLCFAVGGTHGRSRVGTVAVVGHS